MFARSIRGEGYNSVGKRIEIARREGEETAITPNPTYAPLFVLDRRERFGGEFCSLAPGTGLEPVT